jgi:hypothetical protein
MMKVADEVWVAAALLQRQMPQRDDFTPKEIKEMAEKEKLPGRFRPGFGQHISRHCVANKPADPGNHRMLFRTRRGWRRLFRQGDELHVHESRKTGKRRPEAEDLPEKYRELVDWYDQLYYPHMSVSVPEESRANELTKELVLRIMNMTSPELQRLKTHLDSAS